MVLSRLYTTKAYLDSTIDSKFECSLIDYDLVSHPIARIQSHNCNLFRLYWLFS